MDTKELYLVHLYKMGTYYKTCSIVFGTNESAEQYANDCVYYSKIEKVEFRE